MVIVQSNSIWPSGVPVTCDVQWQSKYPCSQITAEIAAKKMDPKVAPAVINQSIDTSCPTGRLLYHMLAAIGEFERNLIKERAAEGTARQRKPFKE